MKESLLIDLGGLFLVVGENGFMMGAVHGLVI
jgi:hypothetical protein